MQLTTTRLILKPIQESELNTLHQMFADPYVRQYLCDDKILSQQQVQEILDQSIKNFTGQNFGLWFMTTHQGEIIGFVGLSYFFDEAQPQLLYALLPQFTRQGYATEAATKILDYSFQQLGYTYLVASCDQPNIASQKLAVRLGMKQVDTRVINGNPIVFFRIDSTSINPNTPII